MTWAAVGVRTTRELLRGFPQDAKALWHVGREYCADEETDGVIADVVLPMLASWAEVTIDPKKLAAALVTRGLWEKTREGWLDVSFLDNNAKHEDRQHLRNQAKERKREERRRKALEMVVTPRRHLVTSPRDSRDSAGRFVPVSPSDVTVATETETVTPDVAVTLPRQQEHPLHRVVTMHGEQGPSENGLPKTPVRIER